MTRADLAEAFMDAWVLAGKPDHAYPQYARLAMGYHVDPIELFRTAFESASTASAEASAEAHQDGYNAGHDDGTTRGYDQGVVDVCGVLLDAGLNPMPVRTRWPRLWAEAERRHHTRHGDGS